MDRRTTLKWVLATSTVWTLRRHQGAWADAAPAGRGYGTDPNLAANYHPGELWPLAMTTVQRRLARILSDIIIPSDERSPSASQAGVVDFIDEWVSAPYSDFQRDRGIVLGGFTWLDTEAARRFGKEFIELDSARQLGMCDDICDGSRVTDSLREAARFFALYRDLTAGGFYSTAIGRKDLDYIGNVPLAGFDGPPPALLKSLGLL
ncbi:MAG: gluconate 2-dehydrogenase subunit 3 family protein [Gammaproteobacteria bacterium]